MTTTKVGTDVNNNANGKVTQSIVTANVGDVIVLWTETSSSTIYMQSASSSHATWTSFGPWTGPAGMTMRLALHIGIVTTATTATVTMTPSAAIGTVNTQFTARQFHTDTGLAWTVESGPASTSNASASTAMTMPTLTSGGTGRLAVGMMVPQNTGTVGATSGYTYRSDDYTSIEAYNLNVSTYAPATATMTSGVYVSAGVLLTPGSAVLPITGTGIASTEAFGTTVVSQSILATAAAGTAEAFGAAAVSLNIAGTGIATTEAFGTHSVAVDTTMHVFPSSITSAETFGTAEVAISVIRAYVGEASVSAIYLGSSSVDAAYIGASVVG